MRIALLVKQVPDVAELRLDPASGRLVRAGVAAIMNPYDRTALAVALDLCEAGGAELVALSMGPPAAAEPLRECLAGGALRAVLLSDPAFAGSDTLATSRALAAALRRLGPVDLVLAGQRSLDAETGQVGPEVAEVLGMPCVTAVRGAELDGRRRLRVVRELDSGTELVAGRAPALLTVVENAVRSRRIAPAAVRAVAGDRVERWGAAELGLSAAQTGSAGSPTMVRGVRAMVSGRRGLVLGGARAAGELVDRLVAEGAFEAAGEEAAAAPGPVRPDCGPRVLVVAEAEDGRPHAAVAELLGAGSALAAALRGCVVALALGGADAGWLGARGADRVEQPRPQPGAYAREPWIAAIAAAVTALAPVAVLAPAGARCREVMPAVAARLGLGMVGDGVGCELDGGEPLVLKPAFGGAVVAPIAARTRPVLATIRPGVVAPLRPDPSRRPPVSAREVTLPEPAFRTIERRPDAAGPADLPAARGSVVCAGHGVGGPEAVRELGALAALLGGVLGGTRRVVEAGWLPRSRQVGLTGHALVCRLYIGFGVRGAANHLVGLRRVGTVVTVNDDAREGPFAAADYGLRCDWRQGLTSLREALRERGLPAPPRR